MQEHEHVAKILQWKLDDKGNWIVAKYGCTKCDQEFYEKPASSGWSTHNHANYVEGCFGCKAQTLQLSTGDANSGKAMSNKKWNKELDAYSDARKQGIQPAGTNMTQIRAAEQASETLGRAYNAETMPPAQAITKAHGDVMKEVGM